MGSSRHTVRSLAALCGLLALAACGGGGGGEPAAAPPAAPAPPPAGGGTALRFGAGVGPVVPLHGEGTALDAPLVVSTADAVTTRFGDRARDRHAREAQFRSYEHYLPFYWEQRTATVEIVDRVARGGSQIVVNVFPQRELAEPEFRAFFRGLSSVAEYHHNVLLTRVGTAPLHYTTTISSNSKEGRALRVGDRMEIEVSQFLRAPTHGRTNYYGTTVLYVVGQGGLVPWEGRGPQLDSYPLPELAWMGGRHLTLPYAYSDEPQHRFKQIAGHLAPASAQPFMEGRRLHHASFDTGAHSEHPGVNPPLLVHAGKLGPQFYATRCVDCHTHNGRSLPPPVGERLLQAVTKVGVANGAPDARLGQSLQPLRVPAGLPPGATPVAGEGSVAIARWQASTGTYADGTAYELRRPVYAFTGPQPSHHSVRSASPLVGLGLLEALDEATIAALADPDDRDGDGVRGRVQKVIDPETGATRLGRFGWKAGTASLRHQIASALNLDMGVLTTVMPEPDCGSAQAGCGPRGAELSDDELEKMVRYVAVLGVAARRNLADPQAQLGEVLFQRAQCTACHTPQLTTGGRHPRSELRNQLIRPYTNLLLHDMGPGLADNLSEADAAGSEWRTPPLWSLGLTEGVSGGRAFLHDGRARTLAEAILWHGGEAEAAKEHFRRMTRSERDALIRFLESI